MFLAGVLDWLPEDVIGQYSSQSISFEQIIFIIISVFLLSLLILFTYKRSYQTTVYNRSFAISLPVIAMVTSVIIISVSSNIILSLGMVGALSIVRFRTAIKNPFDTVFMFWAVGLGVTSGAGLILVAVLSTVVISLVIFLLIALETFVSSYFLIIRTNNKDIEEQVLQAVTEIYGKFSLRNKTIKDGKLDLTLEVRSKEDKYTMVNRIKDIDGVKTVMLLSHQGDYISE
jgi:uncharacterized membrane protein YhiD involved in acid resistance